MSIDAPFRVGVSTDADTVHLRLRGRVDRDAEDQLLAALDAVGDVDRSRVVLDFHDTDYLNSSGLAAIVALLGAARARGMEVVARGLSDHYRHVFEITRLTDLVEVDHAPTPRSARAPRRDAEPDDHAGGDR